MWTRFRDMHSGGGSKVLRKPDGTFTDGDRFSHESDDEPINYIYIEAPKDEAKLVFYNRFKRNPERVSCTCCGEDYYISESETLEQPTERHSLVIFAAEIKASERKGEVPEEGYVWLDAPAN